MSWRGLSPGRAGRGHRGRAALPGASGGAQGDGEHHPMEGVPAAGMFLHFLGWFCGDLGPEVNGSSSGARSWAGLCCSKTGRVLHHGKLLVDIEKVHHPIMAFSCMFPLCLQSYMHSQLLGNCSLYSIQNTSLCEAVALLFPGGSCWRCPPCCCQNSGCPGICWLERCCTVLRAALQSKHGFKLQINILLAQPVPFRACFWSPAPCLCQHPLIDCGKSWQDELKQLKLVV